MLRPLLHIPGLLTLCTLTLGCASSTTTLVPQGGFVQTLGKSHPLAGRIYQVSSGRFVSLETLEAALAQADLLILGETHDNRDHHALEAALTERFLDTHAAAAVGFEMLDEDTRPALRTRPSSADALAEAVSWQTSGWPEFEHYKPVFEVALARRAPLIAAHPSRDHVHASLMGVPVEEAKALQLDKPLSDAARSQLEQEIREAHCGHAPAAMVEAMVRAQSYKDAFMARSLLEARAPAVLITGRGHARSDRAVPHYLRAFGAQHVLSVALLDVADARTTPDAYDVTDFDYVVFTPRVTDEDPCVRFQQQLEHMRKHGAESAPVAPTSRLYRRNSRRQRCRDCTQVSGSRRSCAPPHEPHAALQRPPAARGIPTRELRRGARVDARLDGSCIPIAAARICVAPHWLVR